MKQINNYILEKLKLNKELQCQNKHLNFEKLIEFIKHELNEEYLHSTELIKTIDIHDSKRSNKDACLIKISLKIDNSNRIKEFLNNLHKDIDNYINSSLKCFELYDIYNYNGESINIIIFDK